MWQDVAVSENTPWNSGHGACILLLLNAPATKPIISIAKLKMQDCTVLGRTEIFAEYALVEYRHAIMLPGNMDMRDSEPVFCAGITGKSFIVFYHSLSNGYCWHPHQHITP
jgi:hypothetical protein